MDPLLFEQSMGFPEASDTFPSPPPLTHHFDPAQYMHTSGLQYGVGPMQGAGFPSDAHQQYPQTYLAPPPDPSANQAHFADAHLADSFWAVPDAPPFEYRGDPQHFPPQRWS
eukprot:TRINITY_DN6536_c0_g2_i1.p1 TRINITY_DN6536_c0_g2~~TRINITY_DN6536_c0_g2_i1.p1  ORF type:complete len:131 (-),score=15.64 TRINITY_DN6536_c0_g2_i1:270-605(-)